jgi:hypothetical protein
MHQARDPLKRIAAECKREADCPVTEHHQRVWELPGAPATVHVQNLAGDIGR